MEDVPEQSAKSWRTRLAAQATKAVKSVTPPATRQQVRLAVKTMRAAPGLVATAQAARARKAAPATDRHVIPSEKPGATFRATQAAKAAEVLRATLARETVVCPACTATVEASAVRCRCGHSFCEARAALAKDRDLKRPADKLGDSLTAIYATADIPKAD